MGRPVEQGVDLRDGHAFRPVGDLDDLLARFHLALVDHPQIEAGAAVRDQQGGQAGFAQAHAHAVAGDPRLGDLEDRRADPVAVPHAHLVVGEPVDGEVLTEVAVDEVVPSEVSGPVTVGVGLVDQHGPHLAAVTAQVALSVALDVEAPDAAGAGHRALEDPGVHRLAPPGDVPGRPTFTDNSRAITAPLRSGRY